MNFPDGRDPLPGRARPHDLRTPRRCSLKRTAYSLLASTAAPRKRLQYEPGIVGRPEGMGAALARETDAPMTNVRRRGTHRSLCRCRLRSKTGIRTQARNDCGVVPLMAVLDKLQVGRQMKPGSYLVVVVEL